MASRKATRRTAKKSARKPARKAARKAAKKPAHRSARNAAKKAVRRTARKTARRASNRAVRKAPRKVVRTSARKAARRVVRKAAKRVVRKVVRKAAKKVVRKVVRKAARKVVVRRAAAVVRRPVKKGLRPGAAVVRRPVKKGLRRPTVRKLPRAPLVPPRPLPARPEGRPSGGLAGPAGGGRPAAPERRVLVLGAGLVARPLVRYLLRQPGYHVTVATRTVSKARDMIAGHANGEAVSYDITDPAQLGTLIGKADLAVSLLPYAHHPAVARACIQRRKHMVTTSYVSEDMRRLDAEARAADVVILNEIGVDPGIDHMSAMRIIHKVQREGGSIVHFHSYCGGLPAPEANTNPLGYKFSWSPRGVLMAGRNAARFRKDGQLVEIPGAGLFEHHWEVKIDDLGVFEAYPNRDSLGYLATYGIESAKTMLRGTLRNVGWCRLLKKIADLGLLDETPRGDLGRMSCVQFTRSLLGPGAGSDIRVAVARRLDVPPDSEVMLKLEWLGLFAPAPLPASKGGNLDVLTALMLARMPYARGERDMIVLRHEFQTEYPGGRREDISSTLIDFGVPGGDTSMSRTVALPAAVAARLILEGRITRRGVCIPVEPIIFHPVLDELESLGIHCVDKATVR